MTIGDKWDALRASAWLRGCARVGVEPRLRGRPSMNVYGGTIILGDRCTLASRPVVSHFVAGPEAVLEIGDGVSIGHGAAVAAFERIEIGAGTRIAPFAIIMDTNFHGSSGDQSVQHECRPVLIGRNCTIGSRVTITRGVSIGDGAEILAGSVVSSAIPAGACAAGGRARVIGRAGQGDSRWDSAAALLPVMVMEALGLNAPPELAAVLSGLPNWSPPAVRRLLSDLDRTFGVTVDAATFHEHTSIADLATAARTGARERPEQGRS